MKKYVITIAFVGLIFLCIQLAFRSVGNNDQNTAKAHQSTTATKSIIDTFPVSGKTDSQIPKGQTSFVADSPKEIHKIITENRFLLKEVVRLKKALLKEKQKKGKLDQVSDRFFVDYNTNQISLRDQSGDETLVIDLNRNIIEFGENSIFGRDSRKVFLSKDKIIEGHVPDRPTEDFQQKIVEFNFRNNSADNVDLFFIDYHGGIHHNPIKSGESFEHSVLNSDHWVVYDSKGNLIESIFQNDTGERVEVDIK